MGRKDKRKRSQGRMPAQYRGSGSKQKSAAWTRGRPETEGVHVLAICRVCAWGEGEAAGEGRLARREGWEAELLTPRQRPRRETLVCAWCLCVCMV
jgi:hypothetical protein